MIFTRTFLLDTAERALKTAAQAAAALLLNSAVGLFDIDWADAAATVGTAALVSVLTSLASSGIGSNGTASLVRSVVDDGSGRHIS